ncbi:peptidoglycan hydrolase-like protein with peptidoglycan-binding domain [Spinactinospora alkalitolerans]|uniref:Peptidoglycan hydrolase-like protein with peptidoglycan-binding domain n=1 Tax=Spinactinospora alkalitolerans TaxID=687207 RepID=A0A852TW20_9ACTN|nr:peptidoglycan-binding protein [Spinactinospora alkalitolerans]NYE46070.1 peptidoglycan hydrolase-like protein with peptidoglycan-binding domain [Spinactinospora alkalitolerans]
MIRKRTPVAALAATALALTSGAMAAAPAALADGSSTRPSASPAVEARQWPVLEEGQEGFRVSVVEFLLYEYGHYDQSEAEGVFDEEVTAAVEDYQSARRLPITGKADAETWNDIRDDFGLIGPGHHGLKAKAVQVALIDGYGYDLHLDGIYGPETRGAVAEYQSVQDIDADGWVGPVTFRALITGGD